VLHRFIDIFGGVNPKPSFRKSLLSKRQFEREIRREKVRSSRRYIPFCVLFLTLDDSRNASQVCRLLQRNLRLTDEKAMLSRREFAVLLVDTTHEGGRAVGDRLAKLFNSHGLQITMRLHVHEPPLGGDEQEDGVDYASGHGALKLGAAIDDDRNHNGDAGGGDSANGGSSAEDWSLANPVVVHQTSGTLDGSSSEAWRPEATNLKTADQFGLVDARLNRRLRLVYRPDLNNVRPGESVSSEDPLVRRESAVSAVLKRSVDVTASSVALILLGPAMLATMALIRLTSPGPAIFCQTREGRGGKPFTIYKFRTMVVNAEASQQALRDLSHRDGPAFKIKSDPRVTKFGWLLRATCVDELPQLVNILRGDMSIVGPRPLPWHESRACSHWQRRRLDVRPGLTCFWQINKANVESFDDWMRLDLQYVDRGNLWIDLKLIYRTMAVALLGRGGH
jgi:lipopolysaccharide/colanic/teichoic acid biosynthesis glycosyltransferase/GGDEF domain-containing protein